MVGKTDVFWQRLVYQTVRFMGSFQPNEADAMRSLNMLTHFYGVAWIAVFSAVGGNAFGQTPAQVMPLQPAQTPASQTDDWNQWRGPSRDGKLAGLELPTSLNDQQLRKVWSIPLGPSYSGPLVVGDRVYTTQTIGKKLEAVTAHDRNTGDKLWEKQWAGAMSVPFFAKANGDWIRATPAYDTGKLYVAGMRDKLVCLNADNGDLIWELDFPKTMKSKVPAFGYVSSPLIDGNAIYTQAGQAIFKLNKLTGDVLWKAGENGGGMNSAFSSPMIATLAGQRQLVVQTRNELMGLKIDDGDVIWRQKIEAFRGMNIITPTIDGDSIFVSSYGGKTKLFELVASNDGLELKERWTLPAQGYMCTPVVVDGHAYTHLRNQRFACYDLKNGVEKWRTSKFGKYASLIAVGDKILALDQNGTLMLLKTNPDAFELLDKRKVGSDTWAHLALQGNQVFIRGLKELAMFEWIK